MFKELGVAQKYQRTSACFTISSAGRPRLREKHLYIREEAEPTRAMPNAQPQSIIQLFAASTRNEKGPPCAEPVDRLEHGTPAQIIEISANDGTDVNDGDLSLIHI